MFVITRETLPFHINLQCRVTIHTNVPSLLIMSPTKFLQRRNIHLHTLHPLMQMLDISNRIRQNRCFVHLLFVNPSKSMEWWLGLYEVVSSFLGTLQEVRYPNILGILLYKTCMLLLSHQSQEVHKQARATRHTNLVIPPSKEALDTNHLALPTLGGLGGIKCAKCSLTLTMTQCSLRQQIIGTWKMSPSPLD